MGTSGAWGHTEGPGEQPAAARALQRGNFVQLSTEKEIKRGLLSEFRARPSYWALNPSPCQVPALTSDRVRISQEVKTRQTKRNVKVMQIQIWDIQTAKALKGKSSSL